MDNKVQARLIVQLSDLLNDTAKSIDFVEIRKEHFSVQRGKRCRHVYRQQSAGRAVRNSNMRSFRQGAAGKTAGKNLMAAVSADAAAEGSALRTLPRLLEHHLRGGIFHVDYFMALDPLSILQVL